jgi:GT2 family glycosyltransferase
MILNLKILKKIDQFKNNNFFDENIFLYLENDDLCKRINKFESIYIVPTSKVNHLGASAVNKKYSEQIKLSRNWHWVWSKFYFNKKHYGFLKALIDGLPSFLFDILKLLFYSLINHKKKGIYLHRVLGFLNALFGKKSHYRPKIDY